MNHLKICSVAILFFLLHHTVASTSVPAGYVSGTWLASQSPYIVEGEITIDAGTTLTIEAGVTVEFAGHYKFIVNGRMVAIGSAGSHITFTAQVPVTGWHGLRFIDMNTNPMDTSYLAYCDLYYGIASGTLPDNYGGGIYLENSSKIKLSNCLIMDCTAASGAGIYCNASSPVFISSAFTSNDNHGIYIEANSNPLIRDCTINENDQYGLYINQATSAPVVTGCNISNNTGYPVFAQANQVGRFSGNTYTGNTNQFFNVAGGIITEDAIWEDPGITYRIFGDITVRGTSGSNAITTLVLQPGVNLKFAAQSGLTIASSSVSSQVGGLMALGTASDSVIFTGESLTPGYWDGITINTYAVDSLCKLVYCAIRYGGFGGNNSNLAVLGCDPEVTTSTISNSSGSGMYLNACVTPLVRGCTLKNNVHGITIAASNPVLKKSRITANSAYGINCTSGSPVIDSCLISNNTSYGIYIPNNAFSPVVTNDTINSNGAYPIYTNCDVVRGFDNNSFSGNTTQRIYLTGGTISHDATWDHPGIPYQVASDVFISGTDGPDYLTTLALTPGITIMFSLGTQLRIGDLYPGALFAQGTVTDSVIFTGTTASTGHWKGIYFAGNASDAQSRLEYCRVDYGGRDASELVHCASSAPLISHCLLRYGSGAGLLLDNSTASVDQCRVHNNTAYGISNTNGGNIQVTNCEVFNNPVAGITSSAAINISGCSIHHCGHGVESTAATALTMTGCNASQNDYPLLLFASQVDGLSGNTYTGNTNQQITVSGNTVIADATWEDPGIPYVIAGNILIQGNDGPDAVTTLNLAAGNELRFGAQTGLTIGHATDPLLAGGLTATGTYQEPVVFTANDGARSAGHWNGILFNNTARDSLCRMKFCKVEYGGYSANDGIMLQECSARIENCKIHMNDGSGIACSDDPGQFIRNNIIRENTASGIRCVSSSPKIYNNTFDNQPVGLQCTGTSDPEVFNNIFHQNSTAISCASALSQLNFNDFYLNVTDYDGSAPSGFGVTGYTNGNGDPCDVYANIFLSPEFADLSNYDYSLLPASSCIDAGHPGTETSGNNTCVTGNLRFLEQCIDIGACESGVWFTGAMGTSWHDAGNWSNETVPDANTSVTITTDGINLPIVTGSNGVCKKLYLKNGATVGLSDGRILTISGN